MTLDETGPAGGFGGVYRNRLFMAASTSVYSLYVNMQGVAGG